MVGIIKLYLRGRDNARGWSLGRSSATGVLGECGKTSLRDCVALRSGNRQWKWRQ